MCGATNGVRFVFPESGARDMFNQAYEALLARSSVFFLTLVAKLPCPNEGGHPRKGDGHVYEGLPM